MTLLLLICSYLLGSIPFGLIIAKLFCKIDPRLDGSKSVGATNVARLCGFAYGVATLLFDLTKGACAVLIAKELVPDPYYISLICGFLVLCGHNWSIFLHFKGGKGVSSTIGIFLVLAPLEIIICAIVCLIVIWRSGFVSLGSLVMVTLLPVVLIASRNYSVLPLALAVMCLVFYTHRENIKRLSKHTEKTWKKKREESQSSSN